MDVSIPSTIAIVYARIVSHPTSDPRNSSPGRSFAIVATAATLGVGAAAAVGCNGNAASDAESAAKSAVSTVTEKATEAAGEAGQAISSAGEDAKNAVHNATGGDSTTTTTVTEDNGY